MFTAKEFCVHPVTISVSWNSRSVEVLFPARGCLATNPIRPDVTTVMPRTTPIPTFPRDTTVQTVPSYITVGILVAGFVGGLVIVIAVILFCKFCVQKEKGLRRQSTGEGRNNSDRDRRFIKPLQRYETINSDVFSEPSTGSMEGIPVSPRRCYDSRSIDRYPDVDDINETTKLKSDFDKVSYNDVTDETQGQIVRYDEVVDEQENDKNGRRVSFQLEMSPPGPSTFYARGRRYTEGDFHHLKRSRIEKSVPRQYSLGNGSPFHVRGRSGSAVVERTYYVDDDDIDSNGPRPFKSTSVMTLGDSPSPTEPPLQTEVAVEVHYHCRNSFSENRRSSATISHGLLYTPKLSRERRFRSHSHSMDASRHFEKKNERRVKSYDDIVDYDVLKITEFKGPFYNTDFDIISELGSPETSKVRYNDTGSIEILNEEQLDQMDMYNDFEIDSIRLDESDDTETLNGTQKYRELWNLRTTFEEEEECSDTIRMEDMTSPDQSPDDGEVPNSYTTSFESNTESVPYAEPMNRVRKCSTNGDCCHKSSTNLLHPNYENRRQNYKNILAKRLQNKPPNGSAENSFDSIETVDTDGDVSDTSRQEVTTTSFESTTDNTDSTTESQNHKLIQMKADSGYKSLETQPPPTVVKRTHSTSEIEEMMEEEVKNTASGRPYLHSHSLPEAGPSGYSKYFDRRNGKTASKKRREYSRERQIVQIYESINEPETDSRSDQPSGDSFEEVPTPSKLSLFSRFFKSHREPKERSMMRDYSIDEKTNKVFQEFVRYDPSFDMHSNRHRSPRFSRHRLQRKHTDPMYFEERRRNRLAPEKRSTSLGSDSSASSARRLSPQDSIEEEDYDEVREAEGDHWTDKHAQRDVASRQSLSVHEIPIIKLPEEETCADV